MRSARHQGGSTLVELLVVLVIISTLAVMAVPYAEKGAQRRQENELRSTLREVRMAIDRFHDEVETGRIDADTVAASENGYPVSLDVLVDGVDDKDGSKIRFLRQLPVNPFAKTEPFEQQWLLLGYKDDPESSGWNGEDVYDLRAQTDRIALDDSKISDW